MTAPANRATHLVFLCAGLIALWLVLARLWLLPAHYSREVNEGWNALLTQRLMSGRPLYPAPSEFILNNYPPLSFYLVGWVGRLTGDLIVAGRLVALISFGVVTAEIGAAVRLLGGSRQSAITAMLAFLLFNLGWFAGYIGLDDPQWLAHAVMGGGLLLLIGRPGLPPPLALAGAALLLIAGGMVKHNLLALPLAASLWVLWRDRRAFLLWAAVSAAGLLIAFLICRTAYGDAFFTGLFGHHRVFSWKAMADAAPAIAAMFPLILAAYLSFPHHRHSRTSGNPWTRLTLLLAEPSPWIPGQARDDDYRKSAPCPDPRVALILLFAVIALLLGIVQRGGSGVNYNAHFESLVALAIAAGVGIDRVAARFQPAALLLLPMIGYGLAAVPQSIYDVTHAASRQAAWAGLIAQVRAVDGPVACEEPALCYWAGKGFEIDFFNMGQRLAAGGDDFELRQAIANGHYAAAVVTGPPPAASSQRRVRLLLNRYYRPAFEGPDQMIVYRPAKTSS